MSATYIVARRGADRRRCRRAACATGRRPASSARRSKRDGRAALQLPGSGRRQGGQGAARRRRERCSGRARTSKRCARSSPRGPAARRSCACAPTASACRRRRRAAPLRAALGPAGAWTSPSSELQGQLAALATPAANDAPATGEARRERLGLVPRRRDELEARRRRRPRAHRLPEGARRRSGAGRRAHQPRQPALPSRRARRGARALRAARSRSIPSSPRRATTSATSSTRSASAMRAHRRVVPRGAPPAPSSPTRTSTWRSALRPRRRRRSRARLHLERYPRRCVPDDDQRAGAAGAALTAGFRRTIDACRSTSTRCECGAQARVARAHRRGARALRRAVRRPRGGARRAARVTSSGSFSTGMIRGDGREAKEPVFDPCKRSNRPGGGCGGDEY